MSVLEKFISFYTNLASIKTSELATIYSKDVVFIDPFAQHNGLNSVEEYFTRLLKNAKYCEFIIQQKDNLNCGDCIVTWKMQFTTRSSLKFSSDKVISVDGITLLKITDDKISYHRDYYDLGQMVYENVPVLGSLVRKIKRSIG